MNLKEAALKYHQDHNGKIEVTSKVAVATAADLTLAYTPGVAEPCLEIKKDYAKIYDYTAKGNLVAVVTNGTAVLGLGDIGAGAGLPVMEGKAILFKKFAGVDAFPICLDTKDVDKIVETIKLMAPTFGGINLEDIKAPECFAIEERLKACLDIPVFHDDQHGTAVVVVAGMINALKLTGKTAESLKIVVNGAGAAGTAVTKLLLSLGVKDLVVCDSKGAIARDNSQLSPVKKELAKITNPDCLAGPLAEIIKGRDVFIGVSVPGAITGEMIKSMNSDPMIFAMANPVPEIFPQDAIDAGAKVVGTGRSDFPNQINNVLAFPGIFRGALDVHASQINEEMKIAAAKAIASVIADNELNPNYIIPEAFDLRVAPLVAAAVAAAAIQTGVARKKERTPEWVFKHTTALLKNEK
ncbi:NAD(P)-dependent malic enzyme [Acetobacterium woodii]|uniref:NADP-dependent malic enzyme MaeB2 n=1 Tax=Acetobacterium woodii (strain ATCC 29683 / DSM 1030 / JCM 2381 / KCTC 1655 / WB1) TaxID=931626 RepID=H6LI13_ACEWD|nr:malic enzyme-like NAD(P)-binding protein [Acetobacterium woodii]AFA48543.1 NADP-dependent malic enzyme MaeB2 [Acetobacterium woodii DSM 1030]